MAKPTRRMGPMSFQDVNGYASSAIGRTAKTPKNATAGAPTRHLGDLSSSRSDASVRGMDAGWFADLRSSAPIATLTSALAWG